MQVEAVTDSDGTTLYRHDGQLSAAELGQLLDELQVEACRDGTYQAYARHAHTGIQEAISSGQLHRLDGLALLGRSEDQAIQLEVWFQDGKVERAEDEPAVIAWSKGKRVEERWALGGQLHREDGPAVIMGGESVLRVEYWFSHGQLHGEDHPAILIFISGSKTTEYWYREGVLHREDGPAVVHCRKPIGNQYFLDGSQLTLGEWQRQTAAEQPS